MSRLSSLKAVRTKYRNTLDKENTNAKVIVSYDISKTDKNTLLQGANMCLNLLRTYRSKLEEQMEKLSEVLMEADAETAEKIVDEDCHLIFETEKNMIDLKLMIDTFHGGNMHGEIETTEPTAKESDKKMQEEMHKMILLQLEQQREFFERQEKKSIVEKDSVRLPKLDLSSFNGNKLHWAAFWDSFECTVHKNKKLSNIEKFNYLLNKLHGEAKRAVAGLALSNENYMLAIGILKERFGNEQEIVDMHYNELMNIPLVKNNVESLRSFVDCIEKHLRSLEVLKENVNQHVFVSMIRSKLPQEVLRQLELKKGTGTKWTVQILRDELREYVSACEHSQCKAVESINDQKGKREVKPTLYKARQQDSYQRTYRQVDNYKAPFARKQQYSSEPAFANSSVKAKGVNFKSDQCRYCDKNHYSDECPKYRTIEERQKRIKGSCFKCLRENHSVSECKRNKTCVHCGEQNKHHRSLCPKKFRYRSHLESANFTEEVTDEKETPTENAMVSSFEMVLMQTASTDVKNPNLGVSQQVRILLDCGSQRTYITQKLADALGLKGTKEENIKLITFGSEKPTVIKTKTTSVSLKLNDGTYMEIQANIVPVISGNIERKQIDMATKTSMKHLLNSLDLSDTVPTEQESTSIELLIGNDYYLDIILSQRIEIHPGLYLLGSKFGWILTGRTYDEGICGESASMLSLTFGKCVTDRNVFQCVDKTISTKPDLQDFWNIEAIGVTDSPSLSDDEKALTKFKDTLKFTEGRYQVIWPWRDENPELPVNRELAYGRLRSCVNRMRSKPDLMKKYDMVIKDQLEKGVIEEVPKSINDTKKHYIPHHAVITMQKSTTKLRVVYDASAKSKPEYKSLNECLLRGPVMLHDLCGVIMRFRLHKVGLIADIEKAFLQIGLQPSQRDVTRFMWIKDISDPTTFQNNIQEFRFCRVPFGVISSPFLLGAVIEAHLETYTSDIALKLKRDIYVDNIVTGTRTEGEAMKLYKDAKSMFNEASMNLREWLSNSAVVNETIADIDRAEHKETNVLGHVWNHRSDTLAVRQIDKLFDISRDVTKRSILKVIASVFDPLGLFSPVMLTGKILLQKLWSQKVDWDDSVEDDEIIKQWFCLCSDLERVSKYPFHRCLSLEANEGEIKYRLMCFCDTSSTAYAAAVYLHQEQDEKCRVDLVFAKSRLAPIKGMTIPRLELMAVLIGVRCLKFVTEQLHLHILHRYIWTDSKCVLDWLHSDKHLPVFIRNRVDEINTHKDISVSYVNTKENSADVATRSTTLEDLYKNKEWWHGPSWLLKEFDIRAKCSFPSNEEVQDHNSQNECDLLNVNKDETGDAMYHAVPFDIDIEAYSSLTRLIRVTALVLRFIRKLKKEDTESGTLKTEEIQKAERMWLLHVQRKHFSEVFEGLAKGKQTQLQTQLGLFVDKFGVLRSKGRLEYSSLSEGARHPILLPRKDRFTNLIVERTHKQLLHSGVSQTLSGVRHKYWIPHGRATVRHIVNSCKVCHRYEGGPYKMPSMPSIPKMRVTESPPFRYTGLDYMGPLLMRCSEGTKKIWICLFTCLVTRAIHLEIVLDMSTEEFLLCLRRFISQRGTPSQIISDNASQFKSASSVVNQIWHKVMKDDDVQSYVSTVGIQWSFIVELAPWMGGFYERLVGIVKKALRKAIGRKLLTLIQFQTLLKEVESVVNSRPLTYIGDDINSRITLTPNHFLTLNPTTGIPEQASDDDDDYYIPYESTRENLLKIWKKGQKLLNSFWKMWREDYIMSLRERMQSSLKSGKIKSPFAASVGDTVLLKDDLPRGYWRLGIVVETVLSQDGNVRSAKVKLASGRVLNRPLNLLYPLECSTHGVEETNNDKSMTDDSSVKVQRTERQAAIRAKQKIKEISI